MTAMATQSERPPTPPKAPKLRESCDSCLIAKVKCSKARPLCGRCLANGAPCAYSPSSRSGKRNRNSAGVTKPINTTAAQNNRNKSIESPKSAALPPSASYLTRLMYPLLDDADRSLLDPNTGPLGGTTSPLLQINPGITAPMIDPHTSNGEDVFDSSDFLPTPPFHHGDFMDFMQSSPFDFSAAPVSPRASPPNHLPTSPPWTTKENPYLQKSFQSPLDMIPMNQSTASLTTPRHPPPPPPQNPSTPHNHIQPTNPQSQTCDCFAACLSVLQSLHNHSALLSSTPHGSPPFDVVLSINREAMETCSTMLSCGNCVSKSGRSISTMMLATIFGKVMSLYRAACFLRFSPASNNSSTSSASSSSNNNNNNNTNNEHNNANMPPTAQLAFGAYTVTGENRQLLEIEILLLELRKVESILGVYAERFRNAQAEKDDETSVYDALTGYLDKNLHYIVDFLRMRKGVVSK
ncbi:hypothetical protein BDR22DRAFT_823582 [Usnea florida]